MAPECAPVIKFTTVPAEPKPAGAVVSRAPKMWMGAHDEFWRGSRGEARAIGRERRRAACSAYIVRTKAKVTENESGKMNESQDFT